MRSGRILSTVVAGVGVSAAVAAGMAAWIRGPSEMARASVPDFEPVTLATQGAGPSPSPPSRLSPGPDGPAELTSVFPPEAVEIDLVGDVNLGARVAALIATAGPDAPWRHVADGLRAADIAVANLECTVAGPGVGAAQVKEYTFRGDPASLAGVARAGIDVVSVANNHTMDFGRAAFDATIRHVRQSGIVPVGGGRIDEAYRPAVVERKGMRVAFVAATRVLPAGWAATAASTGVASAYDTRRLVAAVREARAAADAVVVLLHWGVELATVPNATQVDLARALVDAGATAVVGGHPHVLQPVRRYRGAIVAYSLGNFVFSSSAPSTRTSMILRLGLLPDGGALVGTVPVRIEGVVPRPV